MITVLLSLLLLLVIAGLVLGIGFGLYKLAEFAATP